ncbi:DUF4282 domain-containing protein [Salmonella enterica subsp. enterica serovar Kottbus]|nr:DUF4282 domain-containing protein [Salmonella enterica subsp. enterica serovar Kottbus]
MRAGNMLTLFNMSFTRTFFSSQAFGYVYLLVLIINLFMMAFIPVYLLNDGVIGSMIHTMWQYEASNMIVWFIIYLFGCLLNVLILRMVFEGAWHIWKCSDSLRHIEALLTENRCQPSADRTGSVFKIKPER